MATKTPPINFTVDEYAKARKIIEVAEKFEHGLGNIQRYALAAKSLQMIDSTRYLDLPERIRRCISKISGRAGGINAHAARVQSALPLK